jgi:hypothetical protein
MFSHALLAAPGTPTSPLSGGHGDDEEALITHYPLDSLLPPRHSLAFHRALGTAAHLTVQEGRAVVLGEQQFTEAEITLLVPLLDNYPPSLSLRSALDEFRLEHHRAGGRHPGALPLASGVGAGKLGRGDVARAQRHLAHPAQAQHDGARRAQSDSTRLHPGRSPCAAAGPRPQGASQKDDDAPPLWAACAGRMTCCCVRRSRSR